MWWKVGEINSDPIIWGERKTASILLAVSRKNLNLIS